MHELSDEPGQVRGRVRRARRRRAGHSLATVVRRLGYLPRPSSLLLLLLCAHREGSSRGLLISNRRAFCYMCMCALCYSTFTPYDMHHVQQTEHVKTKKRTTNREHVKQKLTGLNKSQNRIRTKILNLLHKKNSKSKCNALSLCTRRCFMCALLDTTLSLYTLCMVQAYSTGNKERHGKKKNRGLSRLPLIDSSNWSEGFHKKSLHAYVYNLHPR